MVGLYPHWSNVRLLISGPTARIDTLLDRSQATQLLMKHSSDLTPTSIDESELPPHQPPVMQRIQSRTAVPWQVFESLAACETYDATMLSKQCNAFVDDIPITEPESLIVDLFST